MLHTKSLLHLNQHESMPHDLLLPDLQHQARVFPGPLHPPLQGLLVDWVEEKHLHENKHPDS